MMVLLTITAAVVNAIDLLERLGINDWHSDQHDNSPLLEAPALGKPIAHGQLIAISRALKKCLDDVEALGPNSERLASLCHLNTLLRGSRLYIQPPNPKPEPTSEYKALMARLRREEESRAYERMVNPLPKVDTIPYRFPFSAQPRIFPQGNQKEDDDDEEITYADVNRQMALIINILVSIVACSVAIWMASSHWSTPKRLGLSMSGSGMIGIAEVVVYAGYLRRLKEAKERGKKKVEITEIIKTWVIGGKDLTTDEKAPTPIAVQETSAGAVRQRRGRQGNILT